MALSAALHLLVLLFALNAWWIGARKLRPVGTANGVRVFRLYDPSQAAQPATLPRKAPIHIVRRPQTRIVAPSSVPDLEEAASAAPDPALGNGEVSIVYLEGFPVQRPDLSGAGASGDVVLDLQINELGRIAQIHTRKGITDSIDRMIIATVQQWIFQPAMRNGHPISSSEELHFHYKRDSANCGWECFSLEAQ
jgi:TonB family protein